jgi:Arc/MetJ-type ribon-helix-helix transcriptional regulator
MTSVQLSLTDDAKQFVDERVAEGGFRDVGEYLHYLVERERRKSCREQVDQLRRVIRGH